MNNGLVSINIVNDKELFNMSYPIMYYWDGTLTLKDDFRNSELHQWLENKGVFADISVYYNLEVYYTIYDIKTKEFSKGKELIREIFELSELNVLCDNILKDALFEAYGNIISEPVYTEPENIIQNIQDNNPNISYKTIINYIRSIIQNKYSFLNSNDIDIILSNLKNN